MSTGSRHRDAGPEIGTKLGSTAHWWPNLKIVSKIATKLSTTLRMRMGLRRRMEGRSPLARTR